MPARKVELLTGLMALACMAAPSALAQETTAYSYDALGRLITVLHSGGLNSGTSTTYSYDSAGNRTNVTVSGVMSGSLSSSSPSNSCKIGSNGLCTLTISWNVTSGSPSNVVVKVGNPETIFASGGASGSSDAPWIQAAGSTFKLYGDTKLLSTLYVQGVDGTLSSSSPTNTCTLGSNGVCTLRIFWNIAAGSPSNVVVKVGSPQTVFASGGASGYSDAPWIQAAGSTFYLYADTTLVATLYARGTN